MVIRGSAVPVINLDQFLRDLIQIAAPFYHQGCVAGNKILTEFIQVAFKFSKNITGRENKLFSNTPAMAFRHLQEADALDLAV